MIIRTTLAGEKRNKTQQLGGHGPGDSHAHLSDKQALASPQRATIMATGRVNETLSKQMSYKGDDGLSDVERRAYEVCKALSCKHEQCYKRYMYSPPAKQREKCGALMDDWKACFAEAKASLASGGAPAR